MTKHQILLRLFELTERTKCVYYASVDVGREVDEVEEQVQQLEANLAQQADNLMADRYRSHNTLRQASLRAGREVRPTAA